MYSKLLKSLNFGFSFFQIHTCLDACNWLHSRLRQPRYRTAFGASRTLRTAANILETDIILEIQRFLRDIIITHIEMEKLNFAPRAFFLGQMVRYLILANEKRIPVSPISSYNLSYMQFIKSVTLSHE